MTLPILVWGGSQFFRGAWAAAKSRSANMHRLIAAGTHGRLGLLAEPPHPGTRAERYLRHRARPRIDREVSLRVFGPQQLGDTWVIPIAWTPTAEHSMLPTLEGDLEVSPLGDDRAQLAISASYRPPLGWLGALSDRALMRRSPPGGPKDPPC